MTRGIAEKDFFDRRRMVRRRYLGKLSLVSWDGNYANLLAVGYTVKIFVGDKEIRDAVSADPDAGEVQCTDGRILKGSVEIRLFREGKAA